MILTIHGRNAEASAVRSCSASDDLMIMAHARILARRGPAKAFSGASALQKKTRNGYPNPTPRYLCRR